MFFYFFLYQGIIKEFGPKLTELTYQLLPAGLELLRRYLSEIVKTVDSTMVQSYINLINYQFSKSLAPMGTRTSLSSDSIGKIRNIYIFFPFENFDITSIDI